MENISIWLLVVAGLRMISVVIGYVAPDKFKEQLFNGHVKEVSRLAARLMAIWTLLTCTVCIVGAFYLHQYGVYIIVLASFYVALFFFLLESAVYGTVRFNKLLPVLFVAGTSIVWLTLHGMSAKFDQ